MRIPTLKAGLLLLAGGGSRRMGEPKALLDVRGTPLLSWQLTRLTPYFEEVLVSVSGPGGPLPSLPPGVRVVHDLHQGKGPLAGIEAGLAATIGDALFVLAVDLPHVPGELAAMLLSRSEGHDAAVPLVEGRPQPLAALYRRSAAAGISIALRDDRLRASAALGDLDVVPVEDVGSDWFRNLNAPEDYRAFIAALS